MLNGTEITQISKIQDGGRTPSGISVHHHAELLSQCSRVISKQNKTNLK